MGITRFVSGIVFALVAGAAPVWAQNVALVVGNTDYKAFQGVPYGAVVTHSVSALAGAGYSVISLKNAGEADMKAALERFETEQAPADTVIVVLSGRFLHAGGESWFAPVDLRSGSTASVGFDALPLSMVLAVLAEHPGRAALFLGEPDAGAKQGRMIEKGVGELNIPQGVTVVRGTPQNIGWAIQNRFLQEDVSVAQAAQDAPLVEVSGFVSDTVSLNGALAPRDRLEGDQRVSEAVMEEAFWQASEDIGSKASYEAYLRRYPNGEYADQATRRLQVIENATPKYSAQEQAEIDLNLTRNDRRRVQEQLDLIGFDPRGIDGVFGPGSRKAISLWQARNGLEGGGFLDSTSLKRLRIQAERRAATLAQEAQRKKAEQDAADARLWAQTGARGSEADYLVYLKAYPDGLYAGAARKGLARIEKENRLTAQAAERQAWDVARQANTVPAYRQFLRSYPNGVFAKTAQGRIAERTLSDQERQMRVVAKREEDSLGMSTSMKVLIETRLNSLRLLQGKADGRFDKSTRIALRKYQKSRGMPVTGFVTRQTVVRLMSE